MITPDVRSFPIVSEIRKFNVMYRFDEKFFLTKYFITISLFKPKAWTPNLSKDTQKVKNNRLD